MLVLFRSRDKYNAMQSILAKGLLFKYKDHFIYPSYIEIMFFSWDIKIEH